MIISQHIFGQHEGHLRDEANDIAKESGAWHVNYTDPCTDLKRGWFATSTLNGAPPREVEQNVMLKIQAIGGFGALRELSSSEARPTCRPETRTASMNALVRSDNKLWRMP